MAALIPRVTQLDAKELDEELHSLFREQLRKLFKYFRASFLTSWEPEIDAILRLAVFSFSIRTKHATVGQQLLNIKYVDSSHFQTPSSKKLWLMIVAMVGYEWFQTRLDSFSIWLGSSQFQNMLSRAEQFTKLISLAYLIVFLVEGKYPTITERLVGLRPVPNNVEQMRQVGYEYVNREILWHGFAEFLVFLVPLVNTRRMWSNLKRKLFQEDSSALARQSFDLEICILCEDKVTLPHQIGCAHVFCYYCVMSEFQEAEKFSCPACGFSIERADLISPVTWSRMVMVPYQHAK